MSTTTDRLGAKAKEVSRDFKEIGDIVTDVAQEKLDQARENAAEYVEQGRDKVHGVACACEQYIRERPLRSVLFAAGIGLVFGRFWKHR
jgi:ElaB/YqjD/DUF883 family membrane-anchored ribosome-binding protein